jgi:GDP-L-fucose synthase
LQPTKVALIALVPEEECTIRKLAETVAKEFDLKETKFDPSMADGQYRKTMSNATLRRLLPNYKFTSLEEGIKVTVASFK